MRRVQQDKKKVPAWAETLAGISTALMVLIGVINAAMEVDSTEEYVTYFLSLANALTTVSITLQLILAVAFSCSICYGIYRLVLFLIHTLPNFLKELLADQKARYGKQADVYIDCTGITGTTSQLLDIVATQALKGEKATLDFGKGGKITLNNDEFQAVRKMLAMRSQ